mmetsp:Transcript_72424/g.132594  ORF Transcript_72424/g.132594 Transcript_72424/m.132594 type:complete len:96 (+) Transcript_72424:2358-2645(+)
MQGLSAGDVQALRGAAFIREGLATMLPASSFAENAARGLMGVQALLVADINLEGMVPFPPDLTTGGVQAAPCADLMSEGGPPLPTACFFCERTGL